MSSEQPNLGPGPVPKEFAAAVRALTEYADAKGTYETECPNECGHCHLCGYLAAFESCLVVLTNPLMLPAAKARRAVKEATQNEH